MLGVASGLVAGLVAITPAAGYVSPMVALVIGVAAGGVCYGAVLAKSRLGYDDALDAFGVHGVGGATGALLTGVFARAALNNGHGGGLSLLGKQAIAIGAAGGVGRGRHVRAAQGHRSRRSACASTPRPSTTASTARSTASRPTASPGVRSSRHLSCLCVIAV